MSSSLKLRKGTFKNPKNDYQPVGQTQGEGERLIIERKTRVFVDTWLRALSFLVLLTAVGALIFSILSYSKTRDLVEEVPCTQLYPNYPRGVPGPLNLSGKNAVVTGCSRGIGREIAEKLAALGVNVICTSRNATDTSNPDRFIPIGAPIGVDLQTLDIDDTVSVNDFVSYVNTTFSGRVDILVTNAARFVVGSILAAPEIDEIQDLINLSIRTVCTDQVRLWRRFFPLFDPTGYSRIISVASVASYHRTGAGASPYFAAKHCLRSFSDSFRHEVNLLNMESNGTLYSNFRIGGINPLGVNTTLYEITSTPDVSPIVLPGGEFFASAYGDTLFAIGQTPSRPADAAIEILQDLDPVLDVIVPGPACRPLDLFNECPIPEPQTTPLVLSEGSAFRDINDNTGLLRLLNDFLNAVSGSMMGMP